jgi:tRNA A37 threonylcarbamoyladenosine dehydratase
VTGDFRVVYSEELLPNQGQDLPCGTPECLCPRLAVNDRGEEVEPHEWCSRKAFVNGSVVTVTATFGMCLASLVINDVVARAAE